MTDTDDRAAAIVAAERRRLAIENAAREIRDRRDLITGHERGLRMTAGQLAAMVRADVAAGDPPVDLSRLSLLTGVSRPSLYAWAAEASQSPTCDLTRVGNAELARMHLGYGPGCHEQVDAEMWARWPHLAGWWRAAQWLRERHEARWWEERGDEYDPFAAEQPPQLPEYGELMRQYRVMVQAVADGPLA